MDQSTHPESIYLQILRKRIEQKLNWGDATLWKANQFVQLSELVLDASGISISQLTLQRVFGKQQTSSKRYNPQLETKNALAIFLGDLDSSRCPSRAIASAP